MGINKRAVTSAIATASLLFYAFATSAFAQTTSLEITGNGSDSDSDINLTTDRTVTVVQENDADIRNDVNASADTGNNDANDNTGGDVTLETGDATTNVEITNQANTNVADLGDCGTCAGDTNITISGNGSDSDNDVTLDQDNTVDVFQDNRARIRNDVDADSDTGDNDANDNTGGDVSISTGNATTTVGITNHANANVANLGNGDDSEGSVDLRITGNGSDSDNSIDLDLDNSVTLVQENRADFRNDVDADADSGNNDANDNTNGDVAIETGDATTEVMVDNMANFNWANVDCCLFDILAKISGNGSDSDNDIDADFTNTLDVFQGGQRGNDARFRNDIDADSDTGYNDAEDNTGAVENDPSVTTGNAESTTEVSNSANLNVFGQGAGDDFETPDFDFDFDFDFDLSDLVSLLHDLMDDQS